MKTKYTIHRMQDIKHGWVPDIYEVRRAGVCIAMFDTEEEAKEFCNTVSVA